MLQAYGVVEPDVHVQALDLSRSMDLVCNNLLCEKVGEACICRLSRVLERLSALEWLSLANNRLQSLPESLCSLPNLRHLDVSQNALVALPERMNSLKHLEYLDVRENTLASLPGSLLELPHLRHFAADGNPGLAQDSISRTLQERHRVHML